MGQQTADNNARTMETLKKVNPELFNELITQDQQLAAIQVARKSI